MANEFKKEVINEVTEAEKIKALKEVFNERANAIFISGVGAVITCSSLAFFLGYLVGKLIK